jgi:hypothetical protein
MQKEVFGWFLTIEENTLKKSKKPYVLFLQYQDDTVMKKQKINMWYYDNLSGYFQFVNNHDYTFFAHCNKRHNDLTFEYLEQIFSLKHARKLNNPAQIRTPKVCVEKSMEID